VLRSAPAVGGVLGALVFTRFPIHRRVGVKMLAGVAGFGAATVVFGVSRWLPLSLVALMVLGACDVVSILVRNSMVQLRTPDEMRGRVASVNSLFIGTSNQLGEFESGMVAGWLGPVVSVVTGGLGTLLIAALWMKLFPQLRGADRIGGEA
jgi:MFS family permease